MAESSKSNVKMPSAVVELGLKGSKVIYMEEMESQCLEINY